MATTTASQHIYTRVESHQSREHVGGYQTLYYSHAGMTHEEAVELESRLVYYPTSTSPPKKVFSTTSTGKWVASQIVPQHVSEQQRPWIGLAHSLVIPAGTAVPFSLFHRFSFISSFDQALAVGDRQTGDIAAVEVSDDRDWQHQAVQTGRGWTIGELRKLAFLALRSERLAKERIAVALVGPPTAIESVLRLAHLLLPDALCAQCTFDTHFCDENGNPCNLTGTYYWAVGLPSAPSSPQFIVVDAQAGIVHYAASWKANGPYERWLESQVTSANWETIAQQRNHAHALAQMLEGNPYNLALVQGAPQELVQNMFEREAELVDTWIVRQLAGTIGPPLGSRLVGAVRHSSPNFGELLAKVCHGFSPNELADLLYAEFSAQGLYPPEEQQITALGRLLGRVNHDELALLHAVWSADKSLQQQLARELPEDAYRRITSGILAAQLPESLTLLVRERADLFVDAYLAARAWQTIPLAELVQRLIQIGAEGHLERLTGKLSHEPRNSLRKIREQLSNHSEVPLTFQHALEEAWGDSRKQVGLLGRLFGR